MFVAHKKSSKCSELETGTVAETLSSTTPDLEVVHLTRGEQIQHFLSCIILVNLNYLRSQIELGCS